MRDNRHNITHQLLGKRDLKGRLLSEREREEIRDARFMSLIIDKPESPLWAYFTEKVDDELVILVGKDNFNAWIDEVSKIHPDPNALTFQDIYLIVKQKLDEERKNHELSSVETPAI